MGGVTSCTSHCHSRDSCMVVYRHVGRDVRAAGGVSIDTAQPVGGVTLRLRLRLSSTNNIYDELTIFYIRQKQ